MLWPSSGAVPGAKTESFTYPLVLILETSLSCNPVKMNEEILQLPGWDFLAYIECIFNPHGVAANLSILLVSPL